MRVYGDLLAADILRCMKKIKHTQQRDVFCRPSIKTLLSLLTRQNQLGQKQVELLLSIDNSIELIAGEIARRSAKESTYSLIGGKKK